MIESVMDYFKIVIKTVDKDLKFDGVIFDANLTASYNLNDTYKLKAGKMKTKRQDSAILADLPITVKIYKVSNNENQSEDFINTYCKAVDILALAMNQANISQVKFKSVEGLEVIPSPLINNENTMEFTIEFNVRLAFNYKL